MAETAFASQLRFVTNFGPKIGRARLAVRNGREYLVAPLSLIVPGVLEGSKGSLFYPPEECARNHKQWDGAPLTVYHPVSETGEHVSANSAGILDRQQIGFVAETAMNGKLQAN